MPADDALYGCQADARAWEFGEFVQALKSSKERTGIRHVETYPVVPNAESLLAVMGCLSELDTSYGARAGEFYGISEQVRQSDLEEPGIAERGQAWFNYELDVTSRDWFRTNP